MCCLVTVTPAPEGGSARCRWCFSLCDIFSRESMIREPLESNREPLKMTSWHLGSRAAPGIHGPGQAQAVGQEAGEGWGWMYPSIFSLHLLSSAEQQQQLGKGLLQRHTCLPGDVSLAGSCRGINRGRFPPGSSSPSHQKVPAPSFLLKISVRFSNAPICSRDTEQSPPTHSSAQPSNDNDFQSMA